MGRKFYRVCRSGSPFQSVLLLPGDGSISTWAFSISKAVFLGWLRLASLQRDSFKIFDYTDTKFIPTTPNPSFLGFFSCFALVTWRNFVNCIQWKLRLLGAVILLTISSTDSLVQCNQHEWGPEIVLAKVTNVLIARSSWFFLVFILFSFSVALWS